MQDKKWVLENNFITFLWIISDSVLRFIRPSFRWSYKLTFKTERHCQASLGILQFSTRVYPKVSGWSQ